MSVRELKNQTTLILKRVEAGQRLIITKRGRPVAVIEASSQASLPPSDSIYRGLQGQIEVRTPGLKWKSAAVAQREFDQISRRISGRVPYRGWRAMNRAAKDDRFGLSRGSPLYYLPLLSPGHAVSGNPHIPQAIARDFRCLPPG